MGVLLCHGGRQEPLQRRCFLAVAHRDVELKQRDAKRLRGEAYRALVLLTALMPQRRVAAQWKVGSAAQPVEAALQRELLEGSRPLQVVLGRGLQARLRV